MKNRWTERRTDKLTYRLTSFLSPSSTLLLRDHYSDVIMSMMAPQITGVSIVYSTICSGPQQRKYQSSASLAFVRGIHWWPVNSPHKRPVMLKMIPFDDVIMTKSQHWYRQWLRLIWWQIIICNNENSVHWYVYALPGPNELTLCQNCKNEPR